MIKLLLADDSVTIQRVVELTFSGEDVQVISVSDGEQAISRLPSERPDIVLADIGMPKRNGYEVAAFVKGHADLAHIPVVLLAGAFEPVDEARAKEVQCDGVLVKPFEPQQVIARVRELVNGAKSAPVEEMPAPAPVRAVASVETGAPPQTGAQPDSQHEPEPQPQEDEQLQAQLAPEPSLDDYFDRLDAAFATLGTTTPESRGATDEPFAGDELPTVNDLLSDSTLRTPLPGPPMDFGRITLPPLEPPDATPTLTAAPRGQASAATRTAGEMPAGNPIAEVFRILLAVEQGDAEAALRFQAPAAEPTAIVTDDLVEEVTRRVLERLAPGTARQVVADIVSEIAERLVREEIARIRSQR